jgi:hypothetical protein
MGHMRTVHFKQDPAKPHGNLLDESAPEVEPDEPRHPLNLYGALEAEQVRIRKHTLGLPHAGHHLKTELHILRGSLQRAMHACDSLIESMENETP